MNGTPLFRWNKRRNNGETDDVFVGPQAARIIYCVIVLFFVLLCITVGFPLSELVVAVKGLAPWALW